jgi:hypothetical protein
MNAILYLLAPMLDAISALSALDVSTLSVWPHDARTPPEAVSSAAETTVKWPFTRRHKPS